MAGRPFKSKCECVSLVVLSSLKNVHLQAARISKPAKGFIYATVTSFERYTS